MSLKNLLTKVQDLKFSLIYQKNLESIQRKYVGNLTAFYPKAVSDGPLSNFSSASLQRPSSNKIKRKIRSLTYILENFYENVPYKFFEPAIFYKATTEYIHDKLLMPDFFCHFTKNLLSLVGKKFRAVTIHELPFMNVTENKDGTGVG